MGLLQDWRDTAYSQTEEKGKMEQFWQDYFQKEKAIYEQLLADPAFTGVDAADIAEMSGFMSDRTMNYYLTATMGVTFSSIRRRTELMAGDKSSK